MKKKLLAKIFIPIIALGILVAPISPILKVENNKLALETKIKKAEAVDLLFEKPVIDVVSTTTNSAKFEIKITSETTDYPTAWSWLKYAYFDIIETTQNDPDPFSEVNTEARPSVRTKLSVDSLITNQSTNIITFETPNTLKQNTYYAVMVTLRDNDNYFLKWPWELLTIPDILRSDIERFPTANTGPGSDNSTGSLEIQGSDEVGIHYDLQCNPLGAVGNVLLGGLPAMVPSPVQKATQANMAGCMAELTYTLWGVSVWAANLAGSMLDFFVYYSISNGAYESVFLTTAWGTIRDISNIFFIIALLFVAIKTILNLNVSNQKRLIGAIIIAALLINFSFFITEVVIDASNILAKVFYNQIQSNPGDDNQVTLTGATPITEKIVANLDPQAIVSEAVYKESGGQFIFIFIAFLALGITLWMAWTFISVAFIFVARIISLWLCIIFSPIAFASFSLPFKIPGVGHQDWLDMLLKNAFLAPIFIFFLYIVILFTESFPQTLTAQFTGDSSNAMSVVTKSLIPILLCFILLTKGKKLAVQYSGEMGKTVTTAAAFTTGTIGVKYVGGFLASKVGAAGRATVGKAGSILANDKGLQKTGFGRFIAGIGKKASESSFDVRAAGGYQKALGAMGMGKYGGKPKGEGGYEKAKAERTRKRMEAAEKMKPRASDPEMKELINSEKDLQSVLIKATGTLDKLDKQIVAAREGATDASNLRKFLASQGKKAGDVDYDKSVEDENMFRSQIAAFKEHKNAIKQGKDASGSTLTYQTRDPASGVIISKNLAMDVDDDYSKLKVKNSAGVSRSILELEKEVNDKKKKVSLRQAENLSELAGSYDTPYNRFLYGAEIVGDAHKIRMGGKLDSGT